MATSAEVLEMLIPNGGWYMASDTFDSIQFIECEPITEAEFNAGFAKYDAWKAEQDAEKVAARQAIFDRLGITEDEAKLLLS